MSGSMKAPDVQPAFKGSPRKTRWDAVFDCAVDFVRDQARQAGGDDVVFSLVLFNDTSQVAFSRTALDKAEVALERARREHSPRGGTGFAAAFKRARELAKASTGGVMCLFLSDGRPGDLQWPPPAAGVPLPSTFRSHRVEYPAATQHLQGLCADHGARLALHYVAIHADGHAWLQRLALAHGGTFHDAELTLDDDEVQIVAPAAAAAAAAASPAGGPAAAAAEDDEVQFIGERSAETAARERQAEARAAGQVVHVGSTMRSSMRSTFRTISSSLTSMRSTAADGSGALERNVTLESGGGGPSSLREFAATRMVLDASQGKFEVPPSEKANARTVRIAAQPFAQGGLRNVYQMIEQPRNAAFEQPRQLVAKESRHVVSYAERLAFHKETSICQARAQELARRFNLRGVPARVPRIEFLRAEVYRLKDPESAGGYRYLAVETRLDGTYEKFNSNNGFVLHDSGAAGGSAATRTVPQAFSHFSFEETSGDEIVVDIQGAGFKYTDPQLHSASLRYGRADRGARGFADFFASHKCNEHCRVLGLTPRGAADFAGAS